jgi:hypothetical protein
MTIEKFRAGHIAALGVLLQRLPESDVTFMEDVSPEEVASWTRAHGRRWVPRDHLRDHLRDRLRDRTGEVQALIMRSHLAEQAFDVTSAVGMAELLEGN